MSFKGIDVRQAGDRLILRASLKDSAGAKLATGTTTLSLYELQSDGTLKSYDFNDNTFKTTALTTATVNMAHRTGNNGTVNTGVWTYALTTISGFARGSVYVAQVSNSGASPAEQEREFQYGDGEGDLSTDALDVLNRTWYVSKAGSDANPGTRDRPFLTIGAAVTAASDGDTIRFLASGTYAELVNASVKSLHFRSASALLNTITGSDTTIPTVRLGSYSSIHGVNVIATATNQPVAAIKCAPGVRDVEVRGCTVTGPFDGLQAFSCFNVRLYDSEFYGNYDSCNVNDCRGFEAHRCYFQTDATYDNAGTGDVDFRAVNAQGDGFSGVFYNCRLHASRADTRTAKTAAINAGRDLRLIDTVLEVYVTNAGGVSEAAGILTNTTAGTSGAVVTRGVHYDVTNAGSGGVKHARTGNCTLYDHGSNCDSTLVVGTMIRLGLDWSRVINQSTSVNLSGTTVGTAGSLATQAQTDVRSALTAQGLTSAWASDVDTQATSAATNALTAASAAVAANNKLPASTSATLTSLASMISANQFTVSALANGPGGSASIDASAVWTYADRTLTAGVIVIAATRQTGRIELVRGMSYLNATANALTFNKSAAFAWPADLLSLPWTVTLYVKPSDRTLDDVAGGVAPGRRDRRRHGRGGHGGVGDVGALRPQRRADGRAEPGRQAGRLSVQRRRHQRRQRVATRGRRGRLSRRPQDGLIRAAFFVSTGQTPDYR
jgi:hypothetical protein